MTMGWLKRLFGGGESAGLGLEELARRLGQPAEALRGFPVRYLEFSVPKARGGVRKLAAPSPDLKALQRTILRKVLGKLTAHEAATGFERGHSIATNARFHAGQAVVVRMDIRDFFASTPEPRVRKYLKTIGWGSDAADVLTRLCTHKGGLPQGAPTSPRLSNLVNRDLDRRLRAVADKAGARYTRYADDLTFSFDQDDATAVRGLIGIAAHVVRECGYTPHYRRKLRVLRAHQRQTVTGLVVNGNAGVRLPRETRRWLRAVEHRAASGKDPTLTPAQREGWQALVGMVERQGRAAG
jgi:hypothetical protein